MVRDEARPVLARGRLVTVDGHPVCAECGEPVLPSRGGGWEHGQAGDPSWEKEVSWPAVRRLRGYREFIARYPWTVRQELCGGAVTSEDDWREGVRRLHDYHGLLAAAHRRRTLRPGENPYTELVEVLAGARRPAWAVPGGLASVLDLPARRRELAATFAWAIPDDGALAVLARYAPLLECGAGTGYWAAVLRSRGVNVVASDLSPPSSRTDRAASPGARSPLVRRRPWIPVRPLGAVEAIRAYPGRVLFVCWPPFDDDGASYAALRAYRGEVFAYVGCGPDGPTGTVRFHRELALNWHPVEQAALPAWPGLRDRLVIYRRNPVRRRLAERDRCPECRRFMPTGSAGRCEVCFARRPPPLALRVNGHRVEYPREVLDAMPRGLRLALERSPSRVIR